jgi:hypothetical protein
VNTLIEWMAETVWGTAIVGGGLAIAMMSLILLGVWIDDQKDRH